MEIRVLGPIEADHEGQPLNLGGPKQRLVLAVLLARANQVVSTDRLVDEVWPNDPPASARQTVQAYVSAIRRVLEPCRPRTVSPRAPGYIATLGEREFDALRFEHLAAEGRSLASTDPEGAVDILGEAEGLWRGDAYADLVGEPALGPEVRRLHELRLSAVEARIDIQLAHGVDAFVIPELEMLVDRHPLREGLRAQLMTALYRSGRQAESLRVYQRTRHVLGQELGIDPSDELQQLEEMILMHDATLAAGPSQSSPVVPEVRYATTSDSVSIAHYTIGSGWPDLVFIPGWVSNIETIWEHEIPARFLLGLASFSRLICYDKRGAGLSDRVSRGEPPSLEARVGDIRTVLDAVGSERAILFGNSAGGSIAAEFAATHPERTLALILYGSFAARKPSPDYPWAPTPAARQRWLHHVERTWGSAFDLRVVAPSMQTDESFRTWWARYLRSGASPSTAATLGEMISEIDIRDIVTTIETPTLVMHRTGDRDCPVEGGRWLASNIAGAQYIEFDGDDHLPHVNSRQLLDAIRAFISDL